VRESEQTAELRKVDDKYKITIDQLNKNYTELQKKMES
jgi:DNA repair exonuclease SbcCD ATPase subunit